jgi:hypothetical protein
MTDSELQNILLQRYYDLRDNPRGECSYQDCQDIISAAAFTRISNQLGEKGLIYWKAPRGTPIPGVGFGRITADGVDYVENAEKRQPPELAEQMKTIKAQCPKCQDEREVLVLKSDTKEQKWEYDEHMSPAFFYEESNLLKCAGCQFVFLQKKSWDTEATDESGRTCVGTDYFPKWAKEPLPEWVAVRTGYGTSNLVLQKLREVFLAFESGWHWLACVGCRSVLEAAMIETIGDKGSFNQNLEAYYTAGHISAGDKAQLKIVIEAGHGATHRSFEPTREEAKTAIDIVCRVLQGIYVHGPQAQSLSGRIPPRQKT